MATPTDNYDPHEFRQVKNPTNNCQAFTHFLKGCIGTGVLAMPNAFANCGYVLGIVMASIIGCVAAHCLHLLIWCMYIVAQRKRVPYVTYSVAMHAGIEGGPACSRWLVPIASPFVDGFLIIFHFGICSVYVVFMAETIKQVVDRNLVVLHLHIHIVMLILPLMLIFSIRDLKYLAPFSTIANVIVIIGLMILIYYFFNGMPNLSERDAFVSVQFWPIFFGTVLFSLEAIGVILAIEENMKKPKDFVKCFGIMNIGMACVIILYSGLGFLGYWRYGSETKDSVTLNIPNDTFVSQGLKLMFAFAIWISYALQGFVCVNIAINKYILKNMEESRKHCLYELLLRMIMVLLTVIAAISIPNLGLFLSLVGAFCLSVLGMVFPAMLHIFVLYPIENGYGPYKVILIKDIIVCILGVVGGASGTYMSVMEITKLYS